MPRSNEKGIPQTNRDTCYFCGSEGPIESHHIIPRRQDGSDNPRNLVDLCPTCHERLERLYDDRFYKMIGAEGKDKRIELIHRETAYSIQQVREEIDESLNELAQEIGTHYFVEDVDQLVNQIITERHQDEIEEEEDKSRSERQREQINDILDVVESLCGEYQQGAPIPEVLDKCTTFGTDRGRAESQIENLKQKGELYEPAQGYLRST